MRLSKVSMVHRVQQEERAVIQLYISEMKMWDCIALGRIQLLLHLVNYIMNRALKLVPLYVHHLIFYHIVIHFVFSKKHYCISRREVLLPQLFPLWSVSFSSNPTSTETSLSHFPSFSHKPPGVLLQDECDGSCGLYCFHFLSSQLHLSH